MATPQDPLDREEDVLRRAIQLLQDRLPTGWEFKTAMQPTYGSRWRPDAVLELTSVQGPTVSFAAEVKRSYGTRDLDSVVSQLLDQMNAEADGLSLPMVVARYLSQPSRDWLTERDIAFVDATGNMRIKLDSPALFIRDVGAEKDPWRGPGRPRGTLKGEPPAKVVRALVDYAPPYSVPQLVSLAESSSGPTYRVVELLDELGLISRSEKGPIVEVAWRKLLERWSLDYGLQQTNSVRSYLQPRGLQNLMERLPTVSNVRYALTGSLAAARWAPYAPAKLAILYTDDSEALAEQCDLRQVDVGANVLIAPAKFDVVFSRSDVFEGIRYVAPSQAVVDLLTGPGRSPAEATALMDWMERNVDKWRR